MRNRQDINTALAITLQIGPQILWPERVERGEGLWDFAPLKEYNPISSAPHLRSPVISDKGREPSRPVVTVRGVYLLLPSRRHFPFYQLGIELEPGDFFAPMIQSKIQKLTERLRSGRRITKRLSQICFGKRAIRIV